MSCTACPLNENALTNCMKGVNRGKTLIVLPGPSSQDDLSGEYDGSSGSGRLLEQICRDAGYKPEDISIAFATRCRTHKLNRITASDIDACRGYLNAQIHQLEPTSIIAMGDVSLKALCKVSGLKSKRGTEIPLHDSFGFVCGVWPTYAPEEVVRVPTFRHTVVSDLRRVRDQSLPRPDVDWTWWEGQSLPDSAYYAFDIETNYFETVGTDIPERITQAAIAGDSFCFVSTRAEALMQLLETKTNIIGHNSWAFDVPKLKAHGVNLELGHDTMYMAYLDDETQPLKLESLCVKYLGVRGWKDEIENEVGSVEFATYNARDVRYTLQLYRELAVRLGQRVHTIEYILRPAREALDAQTARGIWIDPEPVRRERVLAEDVAARSLATLREYVGEKFNPGSSKQVGEYLESVGEKLPTTNSGKPATGIEVLKSLDSPFCRTLVDYRSACKTLSTYISPYEKIIATGDGRVHPDYTLIRTLTGRSSARNLNVQNLDRDLKEFFFAPPGHAFVSVDYSAIEFRVAAWFARESTILEQYREDPNWDPHKFVAAMFYGKPVHDVTKLERQIAKSANFGLLYLGNAFTLYEYANKQGVPMDLTTALEIYEFWHSTFPGFKKFYKETRDEIERTGQSACPTGHIRHFGDFSLLLPHMRLEALRQAVNCKVQNFSAHLAYISMSELHRRGLPSVGFIHDALMFDFDSEAEALQSLPVIEEVMCKYPVNFLKEHFDVDLDIALAVEADLRVHHV